MSVLLSLSPSLRIMVSFIVGCANRKGGDYVFNLKIPVMGADIDKTFSSNEGLYVKMEFLPRGLSIAQATAPNAF